MHEVMLPVPNRREALSSMRNEVIYIGCEGTNQEILHYR